MNLHEECLLKYLLNPLELYVSTELLKYNNELLRKNLRNGSLVANASEVVYSTNSYKNTGALL